MGYFAHLLPNSRDRRTSSTADPRVSCIVDEIPISLRKREISLDTNTFYPLSQLR